MFDSSRGRCPHGDVYNCTLLYTPLLLVRGYYQRTTASSSHACGPLGLADYVSSCGIPLMHIKLWDLGGTTAATRVVTDGVLCNQ